MASKPLMSTLIRFNDTGFYLLCLGNCITFYCKECFCSRIQAEPVRNLAECICCCWIMRRSRNGTGYAMYDPAYYLVRELFHWSVCLIICSVHLYSTSTTFTRGKLQILCDRFHLLAGNCKPWKHIMSRVSHKNNTTNYNLNKIM